MEIPNELKTLYKHWDKHTSFNPKQTAIALPSGLENFISERMEIWQKRYKNEVRPYTKDPILQKFKFCNIYRELDRQTIQIHTDLKQYKTDFDLWLLNLCFHRLVSRPETVKKVGHLSFDDRNNQKVYAALLALPKPKYGNAYVFPISAIQKSKYPTREEFFCLYLPKIIPAVAKIIKGFKNSTVNDALQKILPAFGFNLKFHWTEILIDVAYQFPERIDLFKDFYVGPGALPTAKTISTSAPTETVNACVGITLNKFPFLELNGKKMRLSAENWEGIFCEFRKYTNLKQGKGRIRKY